MPTGYTAYIEDGKITTGKEFLELCLRNFGVAVSMKDEPLSKPVPQKFTLDKYYVEELDKALKRLEEIKAYTTDDIKSNFESRISKLREDEKEHRETTIETLEKYEAVRKDVVKWNPPTKEHESIKKFALEQIDMCVDSLNGYLDSDYYSERIQELEHTNIDEYKEQLIRKAEDDVAFYLKSKKDNEDKVKEKNEFLKKFRDSLEDL